MLNNLNLPHYKIFVEKIKTGNFFQFMCAFSKKEEEPNGILIFGSAVEKTLKEAKKRAFYEFQERLALSYEKIQNRKKSLWRYSISNGVAAHKNLFLAKKNAFFELYERHCILSSWFGGNAPTVIHNVLVEDSIKKMTRYYDFHLVQFHCPKKNVIVTGCFGFPLRSEQLMVYGFGCSDSLEKSVLKSQKEAIQRLCFLWGEKPSSTTSTANTTEFHQEYFLRKENEHLLKKWLNGEFSNLRKLSSKEKKPLKKIFYSEITPVSWKKNTRVVRATSEDAIPLIFGDYKKSPYYKMFGNLPDFLKIHPVC